MPVTTKTFRDQNRLHVIFAVSSLLLAVCFIIAVLQDWQNEYRAPQVEVVRWDTEMTRWSKSVADLHAQMANVGALEEQRSAAQKVLDNDSEYQRLGDEIEEIRYERDKRIKQLQLFVDGNIAPKQQLVERLETLIHTNQGTPEHAEQLRSERAALEVLLEKKREGDNEVKAYDAQMEELKARRRSMEKEVTDLALKIKNLRADLDKATGHLDALEPGLAGAIGDWLRDQPLLDAFNPSIKIKQQKVPDVLTDVNLAQVPTLDRCMSCHVTIDNPLFAEEAVLRFLEFQALGEEFPRGKDKRTLDLVREEMEPAAVLGFWERAVENLPSQSGEPKQHLAAAQEALVGIFASLYQSADPTDAIKIAWSPSSNSGAGAVSNMADVRSIRKVLLEKWPADWKKWYEPLVEYRLTLGEIVNQFLTKAERRAFFDSYRHALVDQYNQGAAAQNRHRLSASRLILAHPRLDLFADPDSKHPIATMGCTSCHEGSGEETQFAHTAHTPANIWVDARTGMLVPDFLVKAEGTDAEIMSQIRGASSDRRSVQAISPPADAKVVLAGFNAEPAEHGEAKHSAGASEGEHAEMFHDDHWYADSEKYEDAFGFPSEPHDVTSAAYLNPRTGELARAVKQQHAWEDHYGWEQVEFHYWERPMHELRYVESSCNRCHAQEMEIDKSAPVLAKGRLLFTQLGCVNCHAVDSLGSPLRDQPGMPDVRQVGPSLLHVKHKLSEDMISSWTWAPKAFRPNTRMPHFFMTENNSSPLDIRRTRAEVAAMSYYLVTTPEDPAGPAYKPEAVPPADTPGINLAGNVEAGRTIFKEVGCLACHSNVNETGLEWVAIDLQDRFGLARDAALNRIAEDSRANEGQSGVETSEDNVGFFTLDASGNPTPRIKPEQYTRLHWYLMHYQPDRYSKVAPELSGVATKLLHNRSRDEARAWVYDWVRNPSHYSDYTRMPRLRLTEQEALDLTAYLLEQKHPTYQPQHFDVDEPMIDALLINLQKNAISEGAARERVAAMTLKEKQYDLGTRMIQHYGCFGCHQISGFDSSLAVSANLSAYGVKDPHKLDFGYFEHIFDKQRPSTVDIWFVEREGLTEDAVKVKGDPHDPLLTDRLLEWEHVENNRRGYIYAKLHNSRIFDRDKLTIEGEMTKGGEIVYTSKNDRSLRLKEVEGRYLDVDTGKDSGLSADQIEIRSVGEPYLKLRMPRFFLRDSDVESLVTYVTSLKPPLVRGNLLKTTDEAGMMRAKGRLMAESLNCVGCHDVHNNVPNIRQYFEVRRKDGSVDYLQTQENLPNAPPRIVGNGAKTQHDWFYSFLNNVEMLRPWLKIRMPSFDLQPQESQWLVEYLAGQTTMDARMIAAHLKPVDAVFAAEFEKQYNAAFDTATRAGNNGAKADEIAKDAASKAVGRMLMPEQFDKTRNELVQTAREFGLYAPNAYPTRHDSPDEFAAKNGRIWYDLHFLRNTYNGVDYPFQAPPVDNMTPEEFALGEGIVTDLGCFACHRLGDWTKLEKIFEIQQAELMGDGGGDGADEGDPYGDDPYGGGGAEEDPYGGGGEEDAYGGDGGEQDPYGSTEAPAQEKPTIYDQISAPNLGITYRRLQEDYVKQWLRKPGAIMPGTKMPSLFGADGRVSAFANFPDALRKEKELLYGSTAEEQMDLITRWIFIAGDRHYTVGASVLSGEENTTSGVDLKEILKQRAEQAKASGENAAPETTEPEVAKPAESGNAEKPAEVKAAPKPEETKALSPEEKAADREAAVAELMNNADAATGSVTGTVVFDGAPPRMQRIRPVGDNFCVQANRGVALYREDIVINNNGSLKDVVVFIRNAPSGSNPLDGPKEIDQVGCVYHPHVISVTTGQTLSMKNTDNTAHNLKFTSQDNGTFNEGQPVAGMVKDVKFAKPEMEMHLACNVHAWMQSLIYAFDHPYHATTGERGSFKIAGLPPGQYELVFHHPELGEQTQNISVEAGKAVRADSTFKR